MSNFASYSVFKSRCAFKHALNYSISHLIFAAATTVFYIVPPLLLRLSQLLGLIPVSFETLMTKAVDYLGALEAEVDLKSLGGVHIHDPPQLLHNSASLREHQPEITPTEAWASSVRTLWRVAMSLDNQKIWDALTSRLLILRSLNAEAAGVEGEWAYKEAVKVCKVAR